MDRRRLLETVAAVAAEAGCVDDVIAPFGFEVDSGFDIGRASPQRVYLYARLTQGTDAVAADHRIATAMRSQAGGLALALGTPTAYLSFRGRRNALSLTNGTGHSVFVYYVPSTAETLIDQYARYLVLLPAAIARGELNEAVHFPTRSSCRRFVYQSVRMFPSVHGIALPSGADARLLDLARANGAHDHGRMRVMQESTPEDEKAFHEIVLPLCAELARDLLDDAEPETVWHDFHSGRAVSLRVDPVALASRAARVAEAYRSAGLESDTEERSHVA
ncbi:hypothetical protein [Compostimonas suwonensis]|uniref:Uncharacterized protein n=1 Tax=Compostimonas suwonensis TaxID=1048394 RepID=A0A2M9BYK6_9MICO|nr:hypothetical protein [Compostimonas suwonensis]PJJ63162.1 hypothetical protein CLV54_0818 [Compostimonas suwonensis]